MPTMIATAAFVRGAARSPAAEPWKAAARPSACIVSYSSSAPRRHGYLSAEPASPAAAARRRTLTPCKAAARSGARHRFLDSASPADAAGRRPYGALAYAQEQASGHGWNSGVFNRRRNPVPARQSSYGRTLSRARSTGSAYSGSVPNLNKLTKTAMLCLFLRKKGLLTPQNKGSIPNLNKLMKTALLCLFLHKKGLLTPRNKDEIPVALRNFTLLVLGLGVGYFAAKDDKKMTFVLKVCDNSMKGYKLFSELATLIVTLASVFFK